MNQLLFATTGITVLLAATVQVMLAVSSTVRKTPPRGPSEYPDVRYYYLPDIEAYFDVKSSRFIYYNGITWIQSKSLPTRYRKYDLYTGRKIVMTDFRGKSPNNHFTEHKTRFAQSFQYQPQKQIGMIPTFNNTGKIMSPSEYSNKKNSWGNLIIEESGNLEKNLVEELNDNQQN